MEDRKLAIPYDPKIRAGLRSVTKQTTGSGNIRFTAERTDDGHADEFWALALGILAAEAAPGPTFADSRPRRGGLNRADFRGY